MKDLLLIKNSADDEFNSKTKKDADELLTQLKDRRLVVYIHFMLDMLKMFELLSLKLQSSTDTIPKISSILKDFHESLESRKTKQGRHEASLLSNALSEDNSEPGIHKCVSWNDFYNAKEVYVSTISPDDLYKGNKFPHIDEVRADMVNSLVITFSEYFPVNELKVYDAFLPSNLPRNVFDCETYYIKEISTFIQSILGNNVQRTNSILNDWTSLIVALIEHPKFELLRASSPTVFWAKFLTIDNLPWTNELKYMIRSILSIPVASADAERGFSILKHIKYDRRSSLSATTLDALLRIRINGPDVKNFNDYTYARFWEKTGHWLTDSGDKSRSKITMSKIEEEINNDLNTESSDKHNEKYDSILI